MKINYDKEIIKCFSQQYPDEIQLYEGLLKGKYKLRLSMEGVKIYDSMVNSFDFLISLIIKLNKTQSKRQNGSRNKNVKM